ncbi:MAG: hypothetical protein VB070_05460 [Clostridiaceae bacterium]|nr:hypothetical protein [Clostridiaceae bacterium]
MNNEMAYLLGMISGNGEIQRLTTETVIAIDIPHKKLETEFLNDVRVYVRASIADIRSILEPLMGTGISFIQNSSSTILSFRKPNDDYLIREILRYIGNASSHEHIRISHEVFAFSRDQKMQFLRGFSDVTGYIRRSNYFFDRYMHRVYLEVPHNWEIVADICNLLKDVDVPVQNIDWAHPNMRDANLTKYNQGFPNFWKKEHQIKIWANEFETIGFGVLHKTQALDTFSAELVAGLAAEGKVAQDVTHKYYWEGQARNKPKPYHPGENDEFIPESIRGTHFDSWKDIAEELGYVP